MERNEQPKKDKGVEKCKKDVSMFSKNEKNMKKVIKGEDEEIKESRKMKEEMKDECNP